MRFFAIILSFYIIGLAFYPSADTIALVNPHSGEKTSDHSHEADNCSPFCICTCCGVQMIATPQLNYYHINVVSSINNVPPSYYKFAFISDYFGSIWQPPQLA